MMEILTFHDAEFEYDVRRLLDKETGPITSEDVLAVRKLDYSNYSCLSDDLETLCKFRNLEELDIEGNIHDLGFLSNFPNLKVLSIVFCMNVDFSAFTVLPHLQDLAVSGGLVSSIDMLNVDALEQLKELSALSIHEFGSVDLKFLEQMPWITDFYCGYADQVTNIASIGSLKNLEYLTLDGIEMDNMDFLNELPDSLSLDFCGDEVHEGINEEQFQRFRELSICEMTVNGKEVLLEIDKSNK